MKLARNVIYWFRVVLPPAWTIVLSMAFYLAIEALHQYVLPLQAEELARVFDKSRIGTVVAITIGYAIFRGLAFHPAWRSGYLSWLKLTPWRFPKPLPLGPVEVVAQDLVVLTFLEILLLDAPITIRLLIPAVFGAVISACWGLWAGLTYSRFAAYEVGYSLGAAIWVLSVSYLAGGVCLLTTFLLAQHRFRKSLARFPWETCVMCRPKCRPLRSQRSNSRSVVDESELWASSYWLLSPNRTERVPRRDRLAMCGLVGLWAAAILVHFRPMGMLIAPITMVVAGFVCFAQIAAYFESHAPPISLFGRLATWRWIIPSYDIAFVPFVYYLAIASTTWLLVRPGMDWPVHYVVPMMLTLYLTLASIACPDLEKWRLTCKSRLRHRGYAACRPR